MEKTEHFENNWEEFLNGNDELRICNRTGAKDMAKMFYEFGYSKGALDSYNIKSANNLEDKDGNN